MIRTSKQRQTKLSISRHTKNVKRMALRKKISKITNDIRLGRGQWRHAAAVMNYSQEAVELFPKYVIKAVNRLD
jgi:hypothetical protein